ncbi:MAG: 7-cyano-7-deazaguanine synthase QueC [Candidatus Cloacimonetes bacterium]|nr:7-cyano-7-deazaguanine synthase QueC [Candidatus Cloacimonadota bacterium]
MNKAIVLVSGGLDSLVSAAVAARDCEELYFLHVNYGQRTQKKELESFEAICRHYAPKRAEVISWDWLARIGGSSLIDTNMEIPTQDPTDEVPSTYVPFRNANLLCAAVAWAEVLGANSVYIGAVEEDSSGYPDCREVFFSAFEKTVETGTKNLIPIKIMTPVLQLSKAEIVKLGLELGAPFEHSWSCYSSNDEACGECESCRLRLKAFAQAGHTDPIKYRNKQK